MSRLNKGHDWPSRLGNRLTLWTVRRISQHAQNRYWKHEAKAQFWAPLARDARIRKQDVEVEYAIWRDER